jgi:hypothetical protein
MFNMPTLPLKYIRKPDSRLECLDEFNSNVLNPIKELLVWELQDRDAQWVLTGVDSRRVSASRPTFAAHLRPRTFLNCTSTLYIAPSLATCCSNQGFHLGLFCHV